MSYEITFSRLKVLALDEFNKRFDYDDADKLRFLALLDSIQAPSGPCKPINTIKKWKAYGKRLITNWDIRMCMKLVECFPVCLPAHSRNKKPICDYNDNGDWTLYFS